MTVYQGNWRELGRRREARRKLGLRGEPIPAACVGRRHPDYGMTVVEHEFAKANRPADGLRFFAHKGRRS
jgi:hypothetical protein